MIDCKICKKYKTESHFSELRRGGYAICNECSKTPEATVYRKKMDKRIAMANLKSNEEKNKEFYEQVDKYEKW